MQIENLHCPSSILQVSNLSANILTPSNGVFTILGTSSDVSCCGNKIELVFKVFVNVVAIPVKASILLRIAD